MALMSVVEFVDELGSEMVHRIPEQGSGELKIGSQVIVRENQWAVFFRDGKALDTFGPGRHTVSTLNIPLITALITTPLFGETPFKADVFYVSKRVFTDLKWGTTEPILFRDTEFKMIRLRANGIYSIQIIEPQLLVNKLVGTRAVYSNGDIEDFLRGIVIGRLADLLGEHLDSVLDLPRYFDELGAGLKARAQDDFAQYGLQLVDFVINAISPPEDVQKRIDERSGMEAVGGMDRYFQFKAAQAIGDIAKGSGGSGGSGGGTDIGGAAATGLGLGAGAGLGMMIPGMLQQAMAGGAQPKVRCPNCSQDIPFGSKFCPECGANLSATMTCPKCQATLPAGSKFCPNCGQQLVAGGAPAAPPPTAPVEAAPADAATPTGAAPAAPAAPPSGGSEGGPAGASRLVAVTGGRGGAMGAKCSRRARAALTAVLGFAVLLAALGFALATGSAAQAKDWRIESMDVQLNVQQNGDVLVDETVTFAFSGSFSRVGRSIPTGNLDGLTDISVSQNGVPLSQGQAPGQWDTSMEGSNRIIQLFFSVTDNTATWTIHYRAQGAIQFFDQGDELRWYVFDADTPVPIDKVTATVTLPGSVPSNQLTGAIDTGPGVQSSVTSPAPSTMTYQGTGVPAYTRFWIVCGFPKGVVTFTWTPRRVAAFVVPKVGFALPIFTFLFMLVLWRRRGRDAPSVAYASYVSEPPSDLPPAVVGALVDEKVDIKEVIATVIDLARRGYLEISEETGEGFLAKKTSVFTRLQPLNDLKGFEHRVAVGVFPSEKHKSTSDDLKNHFYTVIAPFEKDVYTEVTTRGFFGKNPESVRVAWIGIGVAFGVVLAGLSVLMAVTGVPGWGFFLAGAIISTIIVLGFSGSMPHRTIAGAQEQRKWIAFRNYLRDLAKFNDLATARDTFDKYLPYAIAFGVERDWVRRFQRTPGTVAHVVPPGVPPRVGAVEQRRPDPRGAGGRHGCGRHAVGASRCGRTPRGWVRPRQHRGQPVRESARYVQRPHLGTVEFGLGAGRVRRWGRRLRWRLRRRGRRRRVQCKLTLRNELVDEGAACRAGSWASCWWWWASASHSSSGSARPPVVRPSARRWASCSSRCPSWPWVCTSCCAPRARWSNRLRPTRSAPYSTP